MTNKDIEDMKNQIDELVDNLKDRECRNRKLESENEELRKRLEKLESGICSGSPCIVSEFHSFEGESWIRATTYDDVLLRLKKANERIADLEKDRFNKSMDELKRIEKLSSENKSLKQQNDYLKNIFETAYIPESAESMLRKTGFSQEVIDNAKERIESLKKELKAENTALKQRIKDIEDVCDGSCFSDYEDLPFGDDEDEKDELIAELQDQHQQDCIKINQLHVTIDTLVGKYSRLRKTVGMD